jgi:hypothetical protein
VQIVGIAIDQADKVRPYATKMKMNYPILVGEADGVELAQQAGNPPRWAAIYRRDRSPRQRRSEPSRKPDCG